LNRRPLPWARLLAEGAVIVAGVLIALTADRWMQGRDDRELEREYLVQLSCSTGWASLPFSSRTCRAMMRPGHGALDLVRAPELLQALNDYAGFVYFEMRQFAGPMFFYGPVHDVRRVMGVFELPMLGFTLDAENEPVLGAGIEHRIVIPEGIDLADPTITSAAETMFWAHLNAWHGLRGVDIASDRVVEILDGIIDD
jgi:hypothetical protein